MVLEKTLESPLDCKEIQPVHSDEIGCIQGGMAVDQPVHSEGDQSWDFFGGNDAEAETPVLWPPDVKS